MVSGNSEGANKKAPHAEQRAGLHMILKRKNIEEDFHLYLPRVINAATAADSTFPVASMAAPDYLTTVLWAATVQAASTRCSYSCDPLR